MSQICFYRTYLEVDDLAIDDHLLFHEVGSDGGLVGLQEFLVHIAGWQGGYALRRDVLPTLVSRMRTLSPPGLSLSTAFFCSSINKKNYSPQQYTDY